MTYFPWPYAYDPYEYGFDYTNFRFRNPPYPIVRQGWQCPVCKSVFNPDVAMCLSCNPVKVEVQWITGITGTTTTTGNGPEKK